MSRKKQKKTNAGSVYAQLQQVQSLPRCSKCQRGGVTLKVISANGKVQQLCPACLKVVLAVHDERTVPRQ